MDPNAVVFAVLYTLLVAVVSFIYNILGYREGIRDTIEAIRQHEPQAVDRAMLKLKAIINE
jgi:hypothetical protein